MNINIQMMTGVDFKKIFFSQDTILGENVTVDLTAVLKYLLLLKLASRTSVAMFPHTGNSNRKRSCLSTSSGKVQNGVSK